MGATLVWILFLFLFAVAALCAMATRTPGPLDSPGNPRMMHKRAHHHKMR